MEIYAHLKRYDYNNKKDQKLGAYRLNGTNKTSIGIGHYFTD